MSNLLYYNYPLFSSFGPSSVRTAKAEKRLQRLSQEGATSTPTTASQRNSAPVATTEYDTDQMSSAEKRSLDAEKRAQWRKARYLCAKIFTKVG